jgi:endo-alpha-1,4-polygalactosaminidase (GH114 family)
MLKRSTVLKLCAFVLLLAAAPAVSSEASPVPAVRDVWRPHPELRWQLQYTAKPLDLAIEADVFKIDLFDTEPGVVETLKGRGKHAVCYLNVGAWEDWRPDAPRFPRATLGRGYEGWPGERWLDIRKIELLAPVMLARLDLCKAKGFHGVLLDNIDSYIQKTGFRITRDHQLRYVAWIATEAHKRGLAVGINNNPEQVKELLPYVEWAQAESCFSQGWCAALSPVVAAGKPVVVIEYTNDLEKVKAMCSHAAALRFTLLVKKRELDAYRRDCREAATLRRL